jgi:putative membrane protein
MALRWFLATAHLWALGIGLGAVWVRARLLSGRLDAEGLRRVFAADAWWGVAGALWIATGLWRLFGSLEKDTAFYLSNHVFLTKMALLVGLLAMEVRPIVTLTRWRKAVAAGTTPDLSSAPRLASISRAQAWIVILMVAAATAMARGIGAR